LIAIRRSPFHRNEPFKKELKIAGFWANELKTMYFNTYIFVCKILILFILMTILGSTKYSTHESNKNQCTQHQSKTHTHSTSSLFGWFLYSENFQSSQYTYHSVILREAEGEVAESVIQKITSSFRERGTVADGG